MPTLRERTQSSFDEALASFANRDIVRSTVAGDLSPEQYAGVLAQIYFQTRENPQLQALATTRFSAGGRKLVGQFLGHAKSEVGHDAMAWSDIRSLGFSVDGLADSQPLPQTAGLRGFAFHQTLWGDPIAYLGYLLFLEYTPTTAGEAYRAGLQESGIPETALTFIDEHIGVDVAHNKLMEGYLDELLQSESDLSALTHAIEVTGSLYADMLEAGARAGIDPYLD